MAAPYPSIKLHTNTHTQSNGNINKETRKLRRPTDWNVRSEHIYIALKAWQWLQQTGKLVTHKNVNWICDYLSCMECIQRSVRRLFVCLRVCVINFGFLLLFLLAASENSSSLETCSTFIFFKTKCALSIFKLMIPFLISSLGRCNNFCEISGQMNKQHKQC